MNTSFDDANEGCDVSRQSVHVFTAVPCLATVLVFFCDSMELSEVVTLQYAAPVAGVLFCALLVLIFGFKSPVQPPSFDFEYEEKKSQKKQKKQKKSTSNGHVPTESNQDPNKVSPPQPTSKQDQQTNKQPTLQNKVKGKKAAATNSKANHKTETSASKPEVTEEDVGEWTTQLSRKDKKLRVNKKEDGAKGDSAESVSVELQGQGDKKKKEEPSSTTPKSAKSKKEKKQEKKDASKQETETKPLKTEEVVAKVVDETEFHEVSNKKTKPTAKQKEAKAAAAQSTPADEKPVKDKSTEDVGESPKASQTPKKKNKKQQSHQNEAADATLSSPSSPSGQAQVPKKGADSKTSLSNQQNDTKGASNTTESSTKTESVIASSTDDSKVNFDELGGESNDWLEAKPQKKKKKARREN
ncbi:triadin [Lingula anatina]|uniref:Triadin n=1 Tax=Lingula anatina TaxID=7574 RepID=A0A1S3JX29_LINAN|nr:triadin [Lingula anatina]XP_013414589.1 triadin [Lingula anatina]|eukprot:XP_013403389.1 triadin [Lingula anatina]